MQMVWKAKAVTNVTRNFHIRSFQHKYTFAGNCYSNSKSMGGWLKTSRPNIRQQTSKQTNNRLKSKGSGISDL